MAHRRIDSISHHLNHNNSDKMSNNDHGRIFQLIPGVQSYDWGIVGATSSRVAQFASATEELKFKAEEGKPYAELWMGTHPSMPSRVVGKGEGEVLSEYLAKRPDLIGKGVREKFSDEKEGCLPFLFKVLSVGKALSIQAHPDKELGRRLHEERPDVYKDPNHKPEMAIALTPFRGFCGFRPLGEIVKFIKVVPEFQELVKVPHEDLERAGSAGEKETKEMLKKIFSNLMNSPESSYEPLAEQLAERFGKGKVHGVEERERELVLKLAEEFPKDIGIFCTFLLNISSLQPGEALFLQANEPHAYLEGEILECMASSDNVVRAGLTPKLRDVETLVSMCTYQSGSDRGRLEPVPWKKSSPKEVECLLYDPPIEEFSVVTTTLKQGERVENEEVNGPSILLVLEGEVELKEEGEKGKGLGLRKGQLAFVGAETKVEIKNAGQGEAKMARAFVEV